jgi:hypothetical protein
MLGTSLSTSPLEDHVDRIAPMGAPVLINGTWYKTFSATGLPSQNRLNIAET